RFRLVGDVLRRGGNKATPQDKRAESPPLAKHSRRFAFGLHLSCCTSNCSCPRAAAGQQAARPLPSPSGSTTAQGMPSFLLRGPPMCSLRRAPLLGLLFLASLTARAADGNRLTYLDENNPYYPSRTFPRLVTPQWVGEEGVEAVVVLAIDDMREPEKYEKFLRPILNRLKQIDGRAPLSIMTNQV